MSPTRGSTPEPPTYRPPNYRLHARQALAILVEQGVPESEALRRINAQFPSLDEIRPGQGQAS